MKTFGISMWFFKRRNIFLSSSVFLIFLKNPLKAFPGKGWFFILGDPALVLGMFVRKKSNKSGVISIQIIEKRLGKSILLKTVGSSSDPKQVAELFEKGKRQIQEIKGQTSLHFDKHNEDQLVD